MPSIRFGAAAGAGSRDGTPGVPALTIRAIRLFSTITLAGPNGGAPVPSITITLRMVSVGNGPAPSPDRRSGAGTKVPCCASTPRPAITTAMNRIATVFFMGGS